MNTGTSGPWEIGHHQKLENFQTPKAWHIVKHDFPDYPYEGDLEDEYGIYPPMGEAGPVALVAGEDNAYLIAAAPELLEAAKQAYEDLEPFEFTDLSTPEGGYAVMDTVEKLRTAIAKATGEQNR